MLFKNPPLWSDQEEEICKIISGHVCPLKIILKTQDDPGMLRLWIKYHQNIVGLGGLVIFDNMSTESEVSEIYESISHDVQVFRYSGFHNYVHYTDQFPNLYKALQSSCEYFIFLDTDEHLTFFDGDMKFCADPTIIPFLQNHPDTNIFPGTWLQNITGYSDRFSLYDPFIPLKTGLKWGKPIIATKCAFEGLINHNTQLGRDLYTKPLVTNFLVLHLSKMSKLQKINANLKKLVAYGEISKIGGIEELKEIGLENMRTDQATMYAREIFEMMAPNAPALGSLSGSVQICDNGRLICEAEWQHQALQRFVAEPAEYTSELFS
jgi:hypothetical protein